jgi:hypothetical protein
MALLASRFAVWFGYIFLQRILLKFFQFEKHAPLPESGKGS